MGFFLSKQNALNFLQEKAIVELTKSKQASPSQQSSAVIESKICKNFNLLVNLSNEQQILVKQEPHDRNSRVKGDFEHE
jgi:hypothetical protein